MSQPDVVIVHRGWSRYAAVAVRRALAAAQAPVWVISDSPRYGAIPGVRHVRLDALDGGAARFAASYVHLSGNPEGFELFCWQRWFLVADLAAREGIGTLVHLDSDLLLFASAAELAAEMRRRGDGCALCVPGNAEQCWGQAVMGAASAHCSVWTRPWLDEFCAFAESGFRPGPLHDRYQAKWAHHRRHRLAGGVCDMTGLLAFVRSRGGCTNQLEPCAEGVVDLGMQEGANLRAGEFRTALGLKRVRFAAGRPWLERREGGEVPAMALHFQGNAKPLMAAFTAQAGPAPGLPLEPRIALWRSWQNLRLAAHRWAGAGIQGRVLRRVVRGLRARLAPRPERP